MLQLVSKIPYVSLPFFAEIFLAISGLILLVVGACYGDKKTKNIAWALTAILMFAIVILSSQTPAVLNPLAGSFTTSEFLIFIKMLIIFIAICCLALYISHMRYNSNLARFEFPLMMLFSLIGMMVMISANDFLTFYMGLELQSLAIYVLVSFDRENPKNAEAGLKYFILGALSSIFILYGISIIYGLSGTISFQDISIYVSSFSEISKTNFLLLIGLVLLMSGLLFKIAAFPFHMWAPDVYEGSPLFITILFSIVPKIGIIAVILKVFYLALYESFFYWQFIGLGTSFLSIVFGTLKALHQNKIKRFLAYSSISHVGFLLLGFSTGTIVGVQSLLFYLIVYTVMMLNIWSIIISLEVRNKKYSQVKYISDLQGLFKSNPLLAFTFAINMFSMAGVPPLAGFFAKFYVLFSGLESSFNILVIISILFSVISAFYYIRFIKVIFFDDNGGGFLHRNVISYNHSLILGISFLFILFLFIYPSPVLLLAQYFGLSFFM